MRKFLEHITYDTDMYSVSQTPPSEEASLKGRLRSQKAAKSWVGLGWGASSDERSEECEPEEVKGEEGCTWEDYSHAQRREGSFGLYRTSSVPVHHYIGHQGTLV